MRYAIVVLKNFYPETVSHALWRQFPLKTSATFPQTFFIESKQVSLQVPVATATRPYICTVNKNKNKT
jgi:hypothetical protein